MVCRNKLQFLDNGVLLDRDSAMLMVSVRSDNHSHLLGVGCWERCGEVGGVRRIEWKPRPMVKAISSCKYSEYTSCLPEMSSSYWNKMRMVTHIHLNVIGHGAQVTVDVYFSCTVTHMLRKSLMYWRYLYMSITSTCLNPVQC